MDIYAEIEKENKAMAEYKAEELKVENNFNLNNMYAEFDAEQAEEAVEVEEAEEELRLKMIASHDWSNVKGLI